MGLLGHLKDENNLAQKDVMTCLGNTAQFSTEEKKIVDNSRFRPPHWENWAVFILLFVNMVAFRGTATLDMLA